MKPKTKKKNYSGAKLWFNNKNIVMNVYCFMGEKKRYNN